METESTNSGSKGKEEKEDKPIVLINKKKKTLIRPKLEEEAFRAVEGEEKGLRSWFYNQMDYFSFLTMMIRNKNLVETKEEEERLLDQLSMFELVGKDKGTLFEVLAVQLSHRLRHFAEYEEASVTL